MAHIDVGIGHNISMCARCRCHVCVEKIFLTMNVIDRQTHTKHNNIAKVIYKIWTKQKIKGKKENK